MEIRVNGRFRSHRITGVQRYAHEITRRLDLPLCQPRTSLKGWRGHLWEQTVLPFSAFRGLLWSPCAAGPVFARNHVVTIHDLLPLDSPQWFAASFAAGYRLLLQALAHSAVHLIAVSEYTRSRIIARFGTDPTRVSVIHNGVDSRFHNVSDSAVDLALAAVQLPSSRYLLCVGSQEPRKNLARLLSAWARALPNFRSTFGSLWLAVQTLPSTVMSALAAFLRACSLLATSPTAICQASMPAAAAFCTHRSRRASGSLPWRLWPPAPRFLPPQSHLCLRCAGMLPFTAILRTSTT